MNKEIKIHYNPYANDFPIDKRLPKTICGQKNNGNETHIKDGVTCFVCKRMFNNVDKFMNGGLQEMLEDENRIKHKVLNGEILKLASAKRVTNS
jgi:hypothetical protein